MSARLAAHLALIALVSGACSGDDATGPSPSTASLPTGVPETTSAAPTTTGSPPGTAGTNAPATTVPTSPAASPSAPLSTDLTSIALRLTPVAELERPIALAVRPGDPQLFVAEQDGMVWAIAPGGAPQPALDLTDLTRGAGERGLLGVTFSPDGSRFYASYTEAGSGASRVDELAVGADGAIAAASRRQVFRTEQPYANHNGGNVVFGPDGYLYLGLGDGGSADDPQRRGLDLGTPLAKLLRIDPTAAGDAPYQVPPDNPFVNVPGARPEIFSYGLRNPWRFSFDSANGDLWVADVGQDEVEEVNHAPAAAGAGRGVNFGWSAFEGSVRFNDDQPAEGAVPPTFQYRHGEAGCSVTGGYVYRGRAIPSLQGVYLFSDYCGGGVRGWVAGPPVVLLDDPPAVMSFGQDADGELYVLSLGNGVFRIDPA